MAILMNGRETCRTGILLYAIVISLFLLSIPLRDREKDRERKKERKREREKEYIYR